MHFSFNYVKGLEGKGKKKKSVGEMGKRYD